MNKVKWYNNSEKEIQLKDSEPIPEGFIRGRLPKPKRIDFLKKQVSKEALYNKFIIENISFKDMPKEFGVSERDIRILLTYYGIKKNIKQASKNNKYRRTHEQSLEVGKKSGKTQRYSWNKKSEKEKADWAKKCSKAQLCMSEDVKQQKSQAYRDWWFGLSEEERLEINSKRSVTEKETWFSNKEDILSRRKITEKENRQNRLCRSVAEQKMFDALIEVYPDTIYDTRVDNRYPFFCDFYIPSEDLFIELNAHPSHGRLPISELTFDEYSKYPQKWVDVFARRDVEKQNTAKNNGINYIMIYPSATLDENLYINNNHKLVELLYKSQS